MTATPHPCQSRHLPDAACRPAAVAFCHVCQRDTPTVFLPLSSGHVGNCCSVCRATRKRRPYVPRSFLNNPAPTPLEAQGDETTILCHR